MQYILDIHDYDEHFLEQFTTNTIPIYDLWSIRPLENEQKELLSGSSENQESFRNFIIDHANKEFPHPLVIIIGNAEKSNPENMLNKTKRYYKIKFDKFKGNDLGTPLVLGQHPNYPTGNEQMHTLPFAGYGQRPQQNIGAPEMSYMDIQGIVDKNVSDATRSIKAEYQEISAKQNIENFKQMAALETKMEMYKLDMRTREIEEKERKLQEDQELFEIEKTEGLGNVKDYTKTIAGGLLELGKSAFGIDDFGDNGSKGKDDKSKGKKENTDLKGNSTTSFDDDGFTTKEKNTEVHTEPENTNAFSDLMGVIENLSEEQKYQLLNVLIPEEQEASQVESEKLQVKSEEKSNEDEESKNTESRSQNLEEIQE